MLCYLDPLLLSEDARLQVDIVQEHHRRNGFPHAPDPQQLSEVNERPPLVSPSVPVAQDVSQDGTLSIEPNINDLDVTEEVPTLLGELTGSVTKLCSYPYKFREVIEWAKQFAQCGAATDLFPSQSYFIDEKSAEYITEVIAEREAKGVYIPPGESCIASMK